tara:strand:- start:1856 stop:2101 length:246 start_codon:yes stop_codon:yes gene_type:complete
MRETRNKTITVARRGDERRDVYQNERGMWRLPPEEGECYVGGTGAYKECVRRWNEEGWAVQREPNPNYRAPDPLRGLFKLF